MVTKRGPRAGEPGSPGTVYTQEYALSVYKARGAVQTFPAVNPYPTLHGALDRADLSPPFE